MFITASKWRLESGRGNHQTYTHIIIPWVKCSEEEEKCHVENNNGGGKVVRKCLSEEQIKHLRCNLKDDEWIMKGKTFSHLDGLDLKTAVRSFGDYVSIDERKARGAYSRVQGAPCLEPSATLSHSPLAIIEIEFLKNQFFFHKNHSGTPKSGHSKLRRSLAPPALFFVFIMYLWFLEGLQRTWKTSAHQPLPPE